MTPTIQDQLKLERDMVGQGIARYLSSIKTAEEGGRARDTPYARRMTKEMIEPVSSRISEQLDHKKAGRRAKFKGLLNGCDPDVVAYIAIGAMFDHMMSNKSQTQVNIVTLSRVIGDRIHDDLRFTAFHMENKEYYDSIIEDFKRKKTTEYRHMHRVLTKKANERQQNWTPWTENEQVHVGMFCLECIEQSTNMIEITHLYQKRKTQIIVQLSSELMEWINGHMDFMKYMNPNTGPCIIPPDDWTSLTEGGFYSPQLRSRNTLVKTSDKTAIGCLNEANLSIVLEGLNNIQRTSWVVNTDVLDDMKKVWELNLRIGMPPTLPITIPKCPIEEGKKKEDFTEEDKSMFLGWCAEAREAYTQEHVRRSKCLQLSRVLSMAESYRKYNSLYFVYTCDFRGRVYATSSSFHPQGADFAKGLLTFSEGKRLGRDGFKWLCVHGANKFGYDKCSYEDRVEWVKRNHDNIIRCAMDAIDGAEIWGAADKPYQFLAFCHEYYKATSSGSPETFVSRLPIALDGSCNGLQHFSALLKDPVGGSATNLVPHYVPADIYGAVATVLNDKLSRTDNEFSSQWKSYGIDRSICKPPVMTLPYGSTRQTCTKTILQHIHKEHPEHFGKKTWGAAQYLTPVLWDSISDVVVAARIAMKWLQGVSRALAKEGAPVQWTTPIGFPVYQCIYQTDRHELRTRLLGGMKYSLSEPTDKLDGRKQASGVSPNYVHSLDATHMLLVAKAMQDCHLAMIHDDFGTHASDVSKLHKVIREQFVLMYTGNLLQEFKDEVEWRTGVELPDVPDRGSLDIQEIHKAEFFFG